jgi:hypothetical protein
MAKKKNNHGGYRPGAGRPKTKPPTTTLSFRVPEAIAPVLREKISILIKKEVAKVKVDADQ